MWTVPTGDDLLTVGCGGSGCPSFVPNWCILVAFRGGRKECVGGLNDANLYNVYLYISLSRDVAVEISRHYAKKLEM